MADCDVFIPYAFRELFAPPARYRAYFGGRGSSKSHSASAALLLRAAQKPMRILCCREVQNSIADSVKQLLDDKIAAMGLGGFYQSLKTEITGKNGSRFIFAGLKAETVDSLKSKEGVDIAWVEEAQTISQRSLDILRPTIRADGSEIWFTWNPLSEYDPVDLFFRGKNPPPDAVIRKVNWDDNPWFPEVLRKEMVRDREVDPAKASHVWDGDYAAAPAGAYYADLLAKALEDGRISGVPHTPALEVHVSFDLGVGQQQSLWLSQRVGREIRVIDYIEGDEEAANEGYTWYARKLRDGHRSKYNYAALTFPHDGRVREATGKSRAETMEDLSFRVEVLPILPVDDGIDAVKRTIPLCWFDAEKCSKGLLALKSYRENWDEKLRRSNGPLKDWSNHAADSFRYTAVAYEEPPAKKKRGNGDRPGGWMA